MSQHSPTPDPLLDDDAEVEGLVRPEDLSSASRSCSAILVVFVVIGLLLCVFLVGTIFFR